MFKKIGTLLFVTAFLLMLVRPLSASAVTAPDIWVEHYAGILDLTTMQYYYENLSPGQKDICNYLVGMSNYMYLDARGFSFSDDSLGSQSAFIAKMISIGSRILFMDSGLSGWGSRFNPYLQNYISSCVNYAYAQETNIDFYDWYVDLDDNFVLPYSAELLDAWSVWYDDNSIEGIQSLGSVQSPWNSGIQYDFAFGNIPWRNQDYTNRYNDFILNHSPVLFGDETDYNPVNGGFTRQLICGSDVAYPDSIFILRSDTGYYNSFRYGYSNITPLPQANSYYMYIERRWTDNYKFIASTGGYYTNYNVINANVAAQLGLFIQYVFDNYNPVFINSFGGAGWYPLIQHVYLVDNLDTLSNPEEVFNVDDLDIQGGSNLIEKPISPYWWVFKHIDDTFPYPSDPIKDNLIDDNGDPVTDPPLTTSIVNNSTVNNYYITNGEPITVPVNWFSRAESYVSYLWRMTEPLVLYARDLLDCMTFFDDGILSNVKGPGPAIFGICVIGVAGGIVSKLLL